MAAVAALRLMITDQSGLYDLESRQSQTNTATRYGRARERWCYGTYPAGVRSRIATQYTQTSCRLVTNGQPVCGCARCFLSDAEQLDER